MGKAAEDSNMSTSVLDQNSAFDILESMAL
jgi:hypothetical protein